MIGFLTAALRRDTTPILGALVAAAFTALALFVLTLSPAQAEMMSMATGDCAVPGGPLAEECCECNFNDEGIGLCFKSEFIGEYDRCGQGWCPDLKNCQVLVE